MTPLPAPLDDPLTLAASAAALLALLALWAVLAARRAARAAQGTAEGLSRMTEELRGLDRVQNRIVGGLELVAAAQTSAQVKLAESLEARLEEVQRAMGDSLHGASARTARAMGAVHERLEIIDRAQEKIEKLSGDVLGLQDILSNKQARGAFGEIQLGDIVRQALPPDAYSFQAVLSNGRRADCLIRLPDPPGPIVVDSKFPLEAYEALRRAGTDAERKAAERGLRQAVQTHIRAIADRYVIEGETAEGALMFLPSEAVYAELHASLPELVRDGFARRVWIVSPTTLMATLQTLRAVLKDARMQRQAAEIRRELGLLHKDLDRLTGRVGDLDRHFERARQDLEGVRVSARKAGRRAERLEAFEFEADGGEDAGAGAGAGASAGNAAAADHAADHAANPSDDDAPGKAAQ